MSALDDLIARDMAQAAPASLDSIIARDQGAAPVAVAAPTAAPVGAAAQQVPGSFHMGLQDVVRGMGQGLVHGISWAADKIAPDSQFAADFRAGVPQVDQAIQQQNQAYDQARAAAQPKTLSGLITGQQAQPGIDWGRLAGNVVGTLPTMAVGPEYAGLSLPGKIALGAAQGGVGSALMPTEVGPDQSYAGQKLQQVGIGAGLGAAAPAVTSGAAAAGRGLWNAIKPVVQPTRFVGEGLAGAMAPVDAAAAAANIRSAPQFVPGSAPTTAQAAQTPFLVQTEKAAANDFPAVKTAMVQRAIENNNARWQALMGVAQDPAALRAAQAARSTAADPLYAAAGNQTANVGPGFMRLAQRPAVQQAMQQAEILAQNRGEQLVWPQQGGSIAISGKALDYTNRALGDMIGSAKASGNKSLASGLADAQSRLQAWTQRYIPMQRQAAQTYAQMSVPVNTMEVGQQIANGLGTRAMNAGGVPEIQLMPFRSALTSAMSGAEHGIDANALGTLQGIGQDIQRATVSNAIRSPGSDTAYNLAANGWLARNLYGPSFEGATGLGKSVAALGALATGHPLAAGGIFAGGNKLGQMVGARLQDRLSGLLMNPNAVLPYLDARAAAAAQAVPNPLVQRLLNYGRPSLVNGLSGSLVEGPQK